VRGLEWYVLGEGDHQEVIVNVTEVLDTSVVKTEMAKLWAWESFQIQTNWDDEEEVTTEWLVLIGARRLIRLRAAERMEAAA